VDGERDELAVCETRPLTKRGAFSTRYQPVPGPGNLDHGRRIGTPTSQIESRADIPDAPQLYPSPDSAREKVLQMETSPSPYPLRLTGELSPQLSRWLRLGGGSPMHSITETVVSRLGTVDGGRERCDRGAGVERAGGAWEQRRRRFPGDDYGACGEAGGSAPCAATRWPQALDVQQRGALEGELTLVVRCRSAAMAVYQAASRIGYQGRRFFGPVELSTSRARSPPGPLQDPSAGARDRQPAAAAR
jgi:hypothetical protein